jgi:predicted RNA-binding Zn ribbon-like protein
MSSSRNKPPSESELTERAAGLATLGATLQSQADTTQVATKNAIEAMNRAADEMDEATSAEDIKEMVKGLSIAVRRCTDALVTLNETSRNISTAVNTIVYSQVPAMQATTTQYAAPARPYRPPASSPAASTSSRAATNSTTPSSASRLTQAKEDAPTPVPTFGTSVLDLSGDDF